MGCPWTASKIHGYGPLLQHTLCWETNCYSRYPNDLLLKNIPSNFHPQILILELHKSISSFRWQPFQYSATIILSLFFFSILPHKNLFSRSGFFQLFLGLHWLPDSSSGMPYIVSAQLRRIIWEENILQMGLPCIELSGSMISLDLGWIAIMANSHAKYIKRKKLNIKH